MRDSEVPRRRRPRSGADGARVLQVQLLLRYGADARARGPSNETAMSLAASSLPPPPAPRAHLRALKSNRIRSHASQPWASHAVAPAPALTCAGARHVLRHS